MSVASFLVLFCTFFYCIRRRKFSECVGTCFGEINRLDLLTSNLIVTVKLSVKQASVIILLAFFADMHIILGFSLFWTALKYTHILFRPRFGRQGFPFDSNYLASARTRRTFQMLYYFWSLFLTRNYPNKNK